MEEAFAHTESGGKKLKESEYYEPPDGGWGYAVCIGVGLTFVSVRFSISNIKNIPLKTYVAEIGSLSVKFGFSLLCE